MIDKKRESRELLISLGIKYFAMKLRQNKFLVLEEMETKKALILRMRKYLKFLVHIGKKRKLVKFDTQRTMLNAGGGRGKH